MKPEQISDKATRSVKWSALTEIVSRVATPLTFVILARILSPQDFGVVAIAQVSISFCALFWDAGLQKALIQTREPLEKAADVVFWINLVLGLFTYCALYALALPLSTFFDSPESRLVLQVLGLQVVIGSLSTVQQGLLLRDFNFKQLFWARLAMAIVPPMVSIPLALVGYGVWALVASSLLAATIHLIILWLGSPWRPRLSFDSSVARKMANFGSWVVLDSLVGWFISQGDAIVVGRYLGVRDLGFYRTGRNITDIVFSLTLSPIHSVLYPAFSALYGKPDELRSFLYKVNRIIALIALPIGAGMALVSSLLVPVVLGEKWQGLELVISVLGIQMALGWIVSANSELYRAVGRPDIQTKISLFSFPIFLFVYFVAAPLGLTVFVFARLGLTVVIMPVHIWMAVKILKVPHLYLWSSGKTAIFSTLFMVGSLSGVKWLFDVDRFSYSPSINLIALVLVGMVSYMVAIWILDKSYFYQVRDIVKKAFA